MTKIDNKILQKAIRTTFTNQLMFAHGIVFCLITLDGLGRFAVLGIFLIISCQISTIFFAYHREAGNF